MRRVPLACALGLLVLSATSAEAATITYSNRVAFQATLAASVTDDYSNPGYDLNGPGSIDIHSDAYMSSVLGETKYKTTGFTNLNIIEHQTFDPMYCAGCNGSFLLDFTATSVGDASGVFGVGFDKQNASAGMFAFVTFGDGSTANYSVAGTAPGFFGITSDLKIKTIHVGLLNGGTTQQLVIEMDDLTIGSETAAVPAPAGLLLGALGAGCLYGVRRRRA